MRISGYESDQGRARILWGRLPDERLDDVKAVHVRHLDVQNHQVRMDAVDCGKGLAAAVQSADNFHVLDLLQQSRQAAKREWLIVDDQDAHLHDALPRGMRIEL